MPRLLVAQVLGPYCGTAEDGQYLYDAVQEFTKKGEHIELDFKGVELASSSFFGALIGRLTEEHGPNAFRSLIDYRSLEPRLEFVLNHTLTAIHA